MDQTDALRWITELFEEPPGSLSPVTVREAIPTWDSLGVLSLMAALDERFGIIVTADEVGAMKTVGDILGILRANGKLS